MCPCCPEIAAFVFGGILAAGGALRAFFWRAHFMAVEETKQKAKTNT